MILHYEFSGNVIDGSECEGEKKLANWPGEEMTK